jgi:hypothetical protein
VEDNLSTIYIKDMETGQWHVLGQAKEEVVIYLFSPEILAQQAEIGKLSTIDTTE